MTAIERLATGWEWLRARRKRLAPVLAVTAILLIGREILGATPQELEVELPIGADHGRVTQVDVDFLESDELVHHVTLRYPSGAPEAVRHRIELSPGRYVVAVDLVHADGATESRTGRVDAPAEGRVRVHLEPGTEGAPTP